jgi:uncharacterized protein (TIGR02679 family)
VAITLRQLRRHSGAFALSGPVRICENPVVVAAAADALGDRCPPLVCTNGHPSAAVWRMLQLLGESGTEFAYHGDFDWGGVTIATAVHNRIGWRPWRYDTTAYLAATSTTPLSGRPCPTPWDPTLAASMSERAVRIEEELVLTDLLADLEEQPIK